MTDALIQIDSLRKVFGGRPAVESLDLTVKRGEIFGLLGHNGAGKSTTIGMLLGQVWPTSGSVRVCDHDVTSDRQRALEKVGAIFESPVFYDYLSGWKNLQILSAYSGPTPKARIAEVVEWVGLSGRIDSKVRTYSHGMRARLALAQALLPKPELLILDEPSDGLDPEGIHEMRETILRLHRELGLTILLSSHLLNEVEQLCTRIAVMQKGHKVYDGTVADVKSARGRVMLKTPEFTAATGLLQANGVISSASEGRFIVLVEGRTTAEAVRLLSASNIPVDGIWQHEQTLEDFYLNLLKTPPPIPGRN